MRKRSIRWWPALLIVAAVAAMLGWIWLGEAVNTQNRVISTMGTLFLGAVLLWLWLMLLSRLSGRSRLWILLATAIVGVAGLLTLEIKGVSGNLVPIVGFKWSGEGDFADDSVGAPRRGAGLGDGPQPVATVAGVTNPGPNDYPQFYGPDRRASLVDPELATDWQAEPPRELWRRPVGEGWSSLAVAGKAAVTQEQRDGSQFVVRYDLETGQQVWTHERGEAFIRTIGGRGPRATPTIADGVVFALNATGDLMALALDTGTEIWTRNILEDHGASQPEWGMPSSPLVVDELVVVQVGKGGHGLAAYDRSTGEPVWKAGEDDGTYSSPFLARLAGKELILSVQRTSVAGHDPATGELLLEAPWPNPTGGERITMPLVLDGNRVLVSAGYGVGSRLFRVTPTDEGLIAETLWDSPRLKSKFAPMVAHEGVVYGLDDGVLVALDPDTGERFWKRGRYGHGQMILVRDLLLIQAENGEVVLVEATPDEHRELGRFTALDSKTWNPPALSGRLLLVRNNQEAACYELPVQH